MHEDVSDAQKEAFIKSQGIIFPVNGDLETLYNWALIRSMASSKSFCFGAHSDSDEECKKCYLAKLKHCQKLTKHIETYDKYRRTSGDILVVNSKDGNSMDEIDVHAELAKCCIRSRESKTYKVAELVLRSHNKPLNILFEEIRTVLGGDTSLPHARVWFYQAYKRLNKHTGLILSKERVMYLKIKRKK